MPEDKRGPLLKSIEGTEKQQGLKDEENDVNIDPAIRQENQGDLFNQGNTTAKSSDWYFNNLNLKVPAFKQFRASGSAVECG